MESKPDFRVRPTVSDLILGLQVTVLVHTYFTLSVLGCYYRFDVDTFVLSECL